MQQGSFNHYKKGNYPCLLVKRGLKDFLNVFLVSKTPISHFTKIAKLTCCIKGSLLVCRNQECMCVNVRLTERKEGG